MKKKVQNKHEMKKILSTISSKEARNVKGGTNNDESTLGPDERIRINIGIRITF